MENENIWSPISGEDPTQGRSGKIPSWHWRSRPFHGKLTCLGRRNSDLMAIIQQYGVRVRGYAKHPTELSVLYPEVSISLRLRRSRPGRVHQRQLRKETSTESIQIDRYGSTMNTPLRLTTCVPESVAPSKSWCLNRRGDWANTRISFFSLTRRPDGG